MQQRASQNQSQQHSLWGGRFSGSAQTDNVMHRLNSSMAQDQRLWKYDILASRAYAASLRRAGVLSAEELALIDDGLQHINSEWSSGTFLELSSDEDIHSANERRLIELIGSTGGKLHTGRSRNDQVCTDARLWLSSQAHELLSHTHSMISALLSRAESESDALMPGFTHLQPAQPVRWSHFLLSHASALERDAERLCGLIDRIEVSPLGSGALAGNPFGIDREHLSRLLGFGGSVTANSMDAVCDRDFVLETVQWCSTTLVHLSRLAEDLIVYSSPPFSFVRLSEAYSTGSSLMPHKKNPDALELIRGHAGTSIGNVSSTLSTIKGTPSTYNKDLQQCWQPLYDAVDSARDCLHVAGGCIETLSIDRDKMKQCLSDEMLATDLADYLVEKGVPFRETHELAGQAVRRAEESGRKLSDLSLQDLQEISSIFEADVSSVWSLEASVERRDSVGGTSLASVQQQCARLRGRLRELSKEVSEHDGQLDDALARLRDSSDEYER
jgi:argininosuccinate lyase